MALSVIVEESKKNGHNSALVVVEGDSPEEVTNPASKRMATEYAATQLGIQRPGIGIGGSAYPHHAEIPTTQASDGASLAAAANKAGCKYRADWPITGGL